MSSARLRLPTETSNWGAGFVAATLIHFGTEAPGKLYEITQTAVLIYNRSGGSAAIAIFNYTTRRIIYLPRSSFQNSGKTVRPVKKGTVRAVYSSH